jgi:hypothetical protein
LRQASGGFGLVCAYDFVISGESAKIPSGRDTGRDGRPMPACSSPCRDNIGQAAVCKSPVYSAVKAVVANGSLQEIVTTVVKTPGFGHLLVELSAREDLREFAETASSNEELFSLLAAMAADASIQKIVCAIISAPGLAGLLLEIIQQSDLRALTK